jgi:hypothetical protein
MALRAGCKAFVNGNGRQPVHDSSSNTAGRRLAAAGMQPEATQPFRVLPTMIDTDAQGNRVSRCVLFHTML